MAMMRGTAQWAKIVGPPVLSYDKLSKEWTFDLEIDEETQQRLREDGAGFYIKEKEGRKPYVQFKRRELKKDGSPAKPFEIIGPDKQPWDGKTLIGNGSILNVRYEYNEITVGRDKRMKPSAIKIQVAKLVPYEGRDEFPDYSEGAQVEEVWD